ncbi:MAG TPA: rhamnulose-1-phosphate aldolase [Clostridia bacterium]
MKKILKAPFLVQTVRLLTNMYRLGWDERNGGNLSYILKEDEVKTYLNTKKVLRTIPLNFDASNLAGKYFLVTGTGKYFKNVQYDPETNLGIIRIAQDGNNAELLWGFADGGSFTSELPSHLMSHIERLKIDPKHRVVLHCHPTYTVAMSLVHELTEREFTRSIWKVCTECIVVFPEGIGVLPWMVCGTPEIGRLTADKMKQYRLCLWGAHGIFGTGQSLDEAFGLIETVEKAAQLYMIASSQPLKNLITDEQLKDVAEAFKLNYNKDFIN